MDAFSAHPLANLLVLGQGDDGLHVVVGELSHGDALVSAGDVIGEDDGGKHGEAVGGVERAVVIVVIDPRQFLRRTSAHRVERDASALNTAQLFFFKINLAHDFISGLAVVHQVSQKDGVLGAWEAASGDLAGAFLNRDSLVVLVHRLQGDTSTW